MLNKNSTQNTQLGRLLKEESFTTFPHPGDLVSGKIIFLSKNEIRVDIEGLHTGIIRGKETIDESIESKELKEGDIIESTVLEQENENGEIELSLRFAGHKKAWDNLMSLKTSGENVSVNVVDVNRGGLMVSLGSVNGFLPVSQLLPEHYPRVTGGDKNKILEKLKNFVDKELTVRVIDVFENEDKLIVSEKQANDEKRAELLLKYKVGDIVEGRITAITDFGVFVEFDKNFEGLIHISELSWQRVNNPSEIVRVDQKIKAEIINIDGAKIFLSLKRLTTNPWDEVKNKFTIGQIVEGKIIKINPFGLFVQLDDVIQGLAHISELELKAEEKVEQKIKVGEVKKFKIISIEPKHHRLGLSLKT